MGENTPTTARETAPTQVGAEKGGRTPPPPNTLAQTDRALAFLTQRGADVPALLDTQQRKALLWTLAGRTADTMTQQERSALVHAYNDADAKFKKKIEVRVRQLDKVQQRLTPVENIIAAQEKELSTPEGQLLITDVRTSLLAAELSHLQEQELAMIAQKRPQAQIDQAKAEEEAVTTRLDALSQQRKDIIAKDNAEGKTIKEPEINRTILATVDMVKQCGITLTPEQKTQIDKDPLGFLETFTQEQLTTNPNFAQQLFPNDSHAAKEFMNKIQTKEKELKAVIGDERVAKIKMTGGITIAILALFLWASTKADKKQG